MSAIIAIDVGLTGAVALFVKGQLDSVWDLGTVPMGEGTGVVKQRIAAYALRDRLKTIQVCHQEITVYIERQQAMPKQGASSGFSLGMSMGIVLGTLETMGFRYEVVNPQAWKKFFNLKGKDKDLSIARAVQEVPTCAQHLTRKKDHNRADAILIGLYAVRHLNWKGMP